MKGKIEGWRRHDSESTILFISFRSPSRFVSREDVSKRCRTAGQARILQSSAQNDAEISFAACCILEDFLRMNAGGSLLLSSSSSSSPVQKRIE